DSPRHHLDGGNDPTAGKTLAAVTPAGLCRRHCRRDPLLLAGKSRHPPSGSVRNRFGGPARLSALRSLDATWHAAGFEKARRFGRGWKANLNSRYGLLIP